MFSRTLTLASEGVRIGRMTFNFRQIVFFLVVNAFIGLPGAVRSQEKPARPSIFIRNVQVILGMTKDRAYQLFRNAHITLRSTQEPLTNPAYEMWIVCDAAKEEVSGCENQGSGSLAFKDGLLVQASVLWWGPSNASAAALAESLIGATHDLSKRGLTQCEVGIVDQDDPSLSLRRMQVRCGPHYSIQLLVTKNFPEGPTAEVLEILSEKALPLESK